MQTLPHRLGVPIATYIVTCVRKEFSTDATHEHIAGVCTVDDRYYTCQQVVDSILRGDTWKTRAGSHEALIEPVFVCPYPDCYARPYIRTNPDSTKLDNLENLEEC